MIYEYKIIIDLIIRVRFFSQNYKIFLTIGLGNKLFVYVSHLLFVTIFISIFVNPLQRNVCTNTRVQ